MSESEVKVYRVPRVPLWAKIKKYYADNKILVLGFACGFFGALFFVEVVNQHNYWQSLIDLALAIMFYRQAKAVKK